MYTLLCNKITVKYHINIDTQTHMYMCTYTYIIYCLFNKVMKNITGPAQIKRRGKRE